MEYYDSINKIELHTFYMEKCNKLLTCEKVINILDKHSIDFGNYSDIKLFKSDPYQIVNKVNRRKSMSDKDLRKVVDEEDYLKDRLQTEINETPEKKVKSTYRTDIKDMKNKNKLLNKLRVQEEVENLAHKMDKITLNVNKEIDQQTAKFEELKKNRKEKSKFLFNKSKTEK